MKASRAPGAIQSSYVQLHQQKQREIKGGISNKPKNEKNSKGGGNQQNGGAIGGGGAGGILNKFIDIDDIPDFPMDDHINWNDNRNGSKYQSTAQPPHVYLTKERIQKENDDDFDEDNDIDWGNNQGGRSGSGKPYHHHQPSIQTEYGKSKTQQYEDRNDSEDYEDNYTNYLQPSARNMVVHQGHSQKAPPPLPASLNSNKSKHVKIITPRSPRSPVFNKNHLQNYEQYESHAKQKFSNGKSQGDDSSGDDDDGIPYYPQPSNNRVKPSKNDDHDSIDAASVPVPKKKDKALSPRRNSNNFVGNENGHAPPPLPCENPIQSPPRTIPEHEKLFYSKEPRNVDYKPYTLQQYKLIKPKEYVEIGNIKPDLNTEELIEKRKKIDKIKEFSKNLRHMNKELILQQPKLPSATEQADLQISKKKYDSNRIRAMEYAKHIPKPKLNNGAVDEGKVDGEQREVGESRGGGYLYIDEDAFQAAKLQELEAKHQQGKARLEAIKKSISQK